MAKKKKTTRTAKSSAPTAAATYAFRDGAILSALETPLGTRTTYAYDSGNLKRTQDSSGRITTFTVDGNGDLAGRTLPDGTSRLRRPEGGYRATIVNGVATQRGGELTGALPGRMLDVND